MFQLTLAMKSKTYLIYFSLSLFCFKLLISSVWARDITFCGEQIPVSSSFVSMKLMNVIRQQIPYANLPSLHRDAKRYFPMIEYCLKASGMPQDLKYIAVVESGFKNATSKAGAQGFWQLMAPTAIEWGLQVNAYKDERNDIYKSTIAALRELARTYKAISRDYKLSSWVLTAAAYNFGIGRLYKKINTQGKNYFTMNLNPETAVYVYKIIAIKELFEYPELYMKNFKHNIFSSDPVNENGDRQNTGTDDKTDFQNIEVVVKKDEIASPDDAKIGNVAKPVETDLKPKEDEAIKKTVKLVGAQIVGKYPNFKDGDLIIIELKENLKTLSGFQRENSRINGKGWIIDGRVYIDMGFNSNNVILYDSNSEQGIALASLKNKEQVILRVQD